MSQLLETYCMYLHILLYQSVCRVYGPPEAAQQDNDQDNNDKCWKSPSQQEVEQVSALRVLIIHHQHLPEVHCLQDSLRKQIK